MLAATDWAATIAIDGSTIKFQPITTRMHCQLQMEVENTFTQMLSRADSFRIHDNILELYADKELLGKFEAQPGR
jgi:heat shock protein HslJ